MKKKINKKNGEINVVFILDKSGSMQSCWDSTISGFNEYLKGLKKGKEKVKFSLTLFNTTVETRYVDEPLENIKKLDKKFYVPDGMTALYDAVYQTLSEVEKKAKDVGKFLVVIMTDGEENSSKEYTDKNVFAKIDEMKKKGNWTFVFMGANQDSWIMGQKFGLAKNNVTNYQSTSKGMIKAMQVLSHSTQAYACDMTPQSCDFFSEDDKNNLNNITKN